jgi:hypothetical protein
MNELAKTYQEIAMEREHICTGCHGNQRLSHSHLVPKGQNQSLKTVKANIVYHCLSMGEIKGCHSIWESIEFWKLKDAEANMRYIYDADRTYFWLKLDHSFRVYYERKHYYEKNPEISKKSLAVTLEAIEALKKLRSICADFMSNPSYDGSTQSVSKIEEI